MVNGSRFLNQNLFRTTSLRMHTRCHNHRLFKHEMGDCTTLVLLSQQVSRSKFKKSWTKLRYNEAPFTFLRKLFYKIWERNKFIENIIKKALKTVNSKKNFDCKEWDKAWLEIQLICLPYSTYIFNILNFDRLAYENAETSHPRSTT